MTLWRLSWTTYVHFNKLLSQQHDVRLRVRRKIEVNAQAQVKPRKELEQLLVYGVQHYSTQFEWTCEPPSVLTVSPLPSIPESDWCVIVAITEKQHENLRGLLFREDENRRACQARYAVHHSRDKKKHFQVTMQRI